MTVITIVIIALQAAAAALSMADGFVTDPKIKAILEAVANAIRGAIGGLGQHLSAKESSPAPMPQGQPLNALAYVVLSLQALLGVISVFGGMVKDAKAKLVLDEVSAAISGAVSGLQPYLHSGSAVVAQA